MVAGFPWSVSRPTRVGVGAAGATSQVLEFAKRPPRSAGQKVTDEGDGGAKLVEFLASEKFV